MECDVPGLKGVDRQVDGFFAPDRPGGMLCRERVGIFGPSSPLFPSRVFVGLCVSFPSLDRFSAAIQFFDSPGGFLRQSLSFVVLWCLYSLFSTFLYVFLHRTCNPFFFLSFFLPASASGPTRSCRYVHLKHTSKIRLFQGSLCNDSPPPPGSFLGQFFSEQSGQFQARVVALDQLTECEPVGGDPSRWTSTMCVVLWSTTAGTLDPSLVACLVTLPNQRDVVK